MIDSAAVMTQMFLFGLTFTYNATFQGLAEIVKRTLKAIKVNQNDSKPEALFTGGGRLCVDRPLCFMRIFSDSKVFMDCPTRLGKLADRKQAEEQR